MKLTTVYNAAQYALIVPANEFDEAIDTYFRSPEYKVNNRTKMSLDEIRTKYGTHQIASKFYTNQLA